MKKVLPSIVLALAVTAALALVPATARAQFEKVEGKAFDAACVRDFYLEGISIPTQKRNTVVLKDAGGKRLVASLLDTSGYSTEIQKKYAGMLILEKAVAVGGSKVGRSVRLRAPQAAAAGRRRYLLLPRRHRVVAQPARPPPALRNPSLAQGELNFAVGRTIDRIIFLRICEDRGIEFYGQLQAQTNGGEVYARMGQLFKKADERYNSGLFHFKSEKGREGHDQITLSLKLDDKPLKDIIKGLYYPSSPYEFSVLPADILGQVYEQFLGKVIRLTSGGQAKVEEKPEVKKAGGVYYTPTYIGPETRARSADSRPRSRAACARFPAQRRAAHPRARRRAA